MIQKTTLYGSLSKGFQLALSPQDKKLLRALLLWLLPEKEDLNKGKRMIDLQSAKASFTPEAGLCILELMFCGISGKIFQILF